MLAPFARVSGLTHAVKVVDAINALAAVGAHFTAVEQRAVVLVDVAKLARPTRVAYAAKKDIPEYICPAISLESLDALTHI